MATQFASGSIDAANLVGTNGSSKGEQIVNLGDLGLIGIQIPDPDARKRFSRYFKPEVYVTRYVDAISEYTFIYRQPPDGSELVEGYEVVKGDLLISDGSDNIEMEGEVQDAPELPLELLRSLTSEDTEPSFPVVRFTLGHSAGVPVTKRHAWNADKTEVISSTMAFPKDAELTLVECRLDEMPEVINAQPDCFVILGTPKDCDVGQQIKMVSAETLLEGGSALVRKKDNFVSSNLMMFDIDIKDDFCVPPMRVITPTEAITLIEETLGVSLNGVAMLIKPSASAGLFDEATGVALKQSSGFHIYMAIAGATPEVLHKVLHERLVSEGRGHVYVSSRGDLLIRTVFDASVGQSNRIDFFADPVCGEGIVRKVQNELRPGGTLDLSGVDLSVNNTAFKNAALALRSQPKALDLRMERNQAWIENKAAEFESTMSPEEAFTKASSLGARLLKGERMDLYPKDQIIFRFDSGEQVTLEELFNRREEVDCQSLADPFDEKQVRCKAVFYANLDSGKPYISSFAHGGSGYFLHERDEDLVLFPDIDDRDCFRIYDEACGFPGRLTNPPGVYEHKTQTRGRGQRQDVVAVDVHVCDPLHVTAGTSDERGNNHGLVLEFRDIQGRLHRWAMPREMLGDAGDALNRVLADAGLAVNHDQRKRVPAYLATQKPDKHLTSVGTTGWVFLPGRPPAFVTPNQVLGSKDIIFQSSCHSFEGMPSVGGELDEWRDTVGRYARGNPILMISICVALAGPLVRHIKSAESGGIHLQGPSSIGKSTCLAAAVSVWGDRGFLRQWRATANGLEATAAMITDTCLVLDEINEVDPNQLGQSIYMLANGRGKVRARADSNAKAIKQWRLTYLSSGELTPSDYMLQGKTRIQAGQEMRLLNVRVDREFGAFDYLHDLGSGAELSDLIKKHAGASYGHAGMAFVQSLIGLLESESPPDLDKRLEDIGRSIFDASGFNDAQAGRAAKKFALFALAGELASGWGIVPWAQGEATTAAMTCFECWQQDFGEGPSENRKILEAIRDFIDQFDLSRFRPAKLEKNIPEPPPGFKHAGWYEFDENGEKRYRFTTQAFKEATAGFNLRQVIRCLDEAGWIFERDKREGSKSWKFHGQSKRVYCIQPKLDF